MDVSINAMDYNVGLVYGIYVFVLETWTREYTENERKSTRANTHGHNRKRKETEKNEMSSLRPNND